MNLPNSLLPYVHNESIVKITICEAYEQIKKLSQSKRYFSYFESTFVTYDDEKRYVISAVDQLAGKIFILFEKNSSYKLLSWSKDNPKWIKKLNQLGDVGIREVKMPDDSQHLSYTLHEGVTASHNTIYQYEYSDQDSKLDRFIIKKKNYKIFKMYENSEFQHTFLIPEMDLYEAIKDIFP